ncbi:(d)CMP kinase [Kangiella sediminilitoris]|uniref:Cytidylate kinase n=1 Tax=Kangiella sediminilitoris TaxID=1144748 RepID=A0A1B3BBM7_9GAMM|nr:(d)CMP kinase [Kangiella sediminilitoris]AOE50193.1 cytidylate kinase [Kangiella sediminilitoris]
MSEASKVPVITVDGPSGSGKGTISQILATKLGYHLLDSGALYRLTALSVIKHDIDVSDEEAVAKEALELDVVFKPSSHGEQMVLLDGQDVGVQLRLDETSAMASKVAAIPQVREALLTRQRQFRQLPGLVADGRDMGTVVFPDAEHKVFLTASPEIRAERRHKQLIEKGVNANIRHLLKSIIDRDERDRTRTVAPLVPAEGAFVVDSSNLSIDEVVQQILDFIGFSEA